MGLPGSFLVIGCEKYEEDGLESCVRSDQTTITGSIGKECEFCSSFAEIILCKKKKQQPLQYFFNQMSRLLFLAAHFRAAAMHLFHSELPIVWLLFEGGIYSEKYGILSVNTSSVFRFRNLFSLVPTQAPSNSLQGREGAKGCLVTITYYILLLQCTTNITTKFTLALFHVSIPVPFQSGNEPILES